MFAELGQLVNTLVLADAPDIPFFSNIGVSP
jgi:hypothetical protein